MKEQYCDNLLAIGQPAPCFKAESFRKTIRCPDDYNEAWIILFTIPKDFISDILDESSGLLSQLGEFKSMNTRLIGLCTASIYMYLSCIRARKQMTESIRNNCDEIVSVIEDADRKIADRYCLNPDEKLGSVVLIDSERRIRCQLNYGNSTWRNFREIKHVLHALQISDEEAKSPHKK